MVKVEPWITQTAAQLTPKQRHDNRLIFEGLGQTLEKPGFGEKPGF